MKKIIIVITLISTLVLGILLGRVTSNVQTTVENISFMDSSKIVFVNNDQTREYNGGSYNFGSSEINKLSNMEKFNKHDLQVVNSIDANHGLDQGKYGAAIMIPSNFTDSVLSVNDEIAKSSTITYEISDTLSLENQKEMVTAVNAIIDTIKTDISYMYIYAIFDSLHLTQSGIDTIITNMSSVYDFTQDLDGVDVFSNYDFELSEYEDYDLENIDISEQLKQYVETVSSYFNAVDDSIITLQANIEISKQDFLEYLIEADDNYESLLATVDDSVANYQNLVTGQMEVIEEYADKLEEIDIQDELDLIAEILKYEINSLNGDDSIVTNEFKSSQEELNHIFKIYLNINKLSELSFTSSGEVETILKLDENIKAKNQQLTDLEIYGYINDYIEASESLRDCFASSAVSDVCLNTNLKNLQKQKGNVDKAIDRFQVKFNDSYDHVEDEVNMILSDPTYSDEDAVNYLNNIINRPLFTLYQDITYSYSLIRTNAHEFVSSNRLIFKQYQDVIKVLSEASTFTSEEINTLNSEISKEEEDINFEAISGICGDKYESEITCKIIKDYRDMKNNIFNVTNALEPQRVDVNNEEVEYIEDMCAKPLSIAYVFEGWNCTVDGNIKHYLGINSKLANQNENLENINTTIVTLENDSSLALENIEVAIEAINDVEISLDEYEEVEYENVDASSYIDTLKQTNESIENEYGVVEEVNNEIYEGIYETYMENIEAYMEYIDKVEGDQTYGDLIEAFVNDENARQLVSLEYLQETGELMPNTITQGLPNKLIYNHIANPVTSSEIAKGKVDTELAANSSAKPKWRYILIIILLTIIIVGALYVTRKNDNEQSGEGKRNN